METLHTQWDTFHLRHMVGKWLHTKTKYLTTQIIKPVDWDAGAGSVDSGTTNLPEDLISDISLLQASLRLKDWDGGAVDCYFLNMRNETVSLWQV